MYIGMPEGLNLTHNIIEADFSPTRDDLSETLDACKRAQHEPFPRPTVDRTRGWKSRQTLHGDGRLCHKAITPIDRETPSFFCGLVCILCDIADRSISGGSLEYVRATICIIVTVTDVVSDEEILRPFFNITSIGPPGLTRTATSAFRRTSTAKALDYNLFDVNAAVA
ncbi:hypothetical protein LTR95_010818 [Oleoguttula sp. CCFEE 5521]